MLFINMPAALIRMIWIAGKWQVTLSCYALPGEEKFCGMLAHKGMVTWTGFHLNKNFIFTVTVHLVSLIMFFIEKDIYFLERLISIILNVTKSLSLNIWKINFNYIKIIRQTLVNSINIKFHENFLIYSTVLQRAVQSQ